MQKAKTWNKVRFGRRCRGECSPIIQINFYVLAWVWMSIINCKKAEIYFGSTSSQRSRSSVMFNK